MRARLAGEVADAVRLVHAAAVLLIVGAAATAAAIAAAVAADVAVRARNVLAEERGVMPAAAAAAAAAAGGAVAVAVGVAVGARQQRKVLTELGERLGGAVRAARG